MRVANQEFNAILFVARREFDAGFVRELRTSIRRREGDINLREAR